MGRLFIMAIVILTLGACGRMFRAAHDRTSATRELQVLDAALNARAVGILGTDCASCHGPGGPGDGGFGSIGNTARMVSEGWIVIGKPASSPLYQRMAAGQMPPSGAVAAADVQTIHDWIDHGLGSAAPVPTPTPTPAGPAYVINDAAKNTTALALLKTQCVGCHGTASTGYGGFKCADNLDQMVAQGFVVPGSPDNSRLYGRVKDGSMPLGTGLGASDVTLIHDWIQYALAKP